MVTPKRSIDLGIWGLALGYFVFYVPYSALTKALSKGLLPGMEGPVPGFELLPATAIATTLTLPLFITVAGWWKYVPNRGHFLGLPFPIPRWQTLISGMATAVIIATTTLNYTFVGISIVFALLMMRGGVLILSPVIDFFFKRKVNWYSWMALVLSLIAVSVAFAEQGGYFLTLMAALNVGAYLVGYMFRLQFMTRIAKSKRHAVNMQFFVEETFVAAVTLLTALALLAFIGQGTIMMELRAGFTTFLTSKLVVPAFLIGCLYACLYMFGSRIYLDHRENTFCIPLNRCASLLSGVVASYALVFLLGQSMPSSQQLLAAGILVAAIFFLGFPAWQERGQRGSNAILPHLARRAFLFICNDNVCRSPMAQAICRDELVSLLNLSPDALAATNRQVRSAGLTAIPGAPMSAGALQALRLRGVTPHEHASQKVSATLIEQADVIYCMTAQQCQALVERFPEAAPKVHRLDPNGDLIKGPGGDILEKLAEQMQQVIRQRLQALEWAVA